MPSTGVIVTTLAFGSLLPGVRSDTERLFVVNGCGEDMWIAGTAANDVEVPGGAVQYVAPGDQISYWIPDGGLEGFRFWPKMGCNDDGQKCEIGDSGGPGQECGDQGCAPPIDSKFEGTFGQVGGEPDWWDTSAVDGFSLPYTVDISESCAEMIGIPVGCQTSWDCPSVSLENVGDVDLTVYHPDTGRVVGCYSPCTVLTHNNWNNPVGVYSPGDDVADPYCCAVRGTEECNAGPAEYSDYNQFIHSECQNVYGFAYDDAAALKQCPADTIYTWTIYCPDSRSGVKLSNATLAV